MRQSYSSGTDAEGAVHAATVQLLHTSTPKNCAAELYNHPVHVTGQSQRQVAPPFPSTTLHISAAPLRPDSESTTPING